jgi:PadR family transcriptional regulator PadR
MTAAALGADARRALVGDASSIDEREALTVDARLAPACRGGRLLDNKKMSSYFAPMPRRKPGTLLPLETEILEVALSMLRSGHATFHGFGLAQSMREQSGSRSLTAHGTLYKALSRLEEFGLLTSRWEDAAAVDGRPRRRLYALTSQGAHAAEQALAGKADKASGRSPRVASEPV